MGCLQREVGCVEVEVCTMILDGPCKGHLHVPHNLVKACGQSCSCKVQHVDFAPCGLVPWKVRLFEIEGPSYVSSTR